MRFLETPLGPVGLGERQLLAYLTFKRHHEVAQDACCKPPQSVKALLQRVTNIRRGLAEFGEFVEAPPVLAAGAEYSMFVKRKLSERAT